MAARVGLSSMSRMPEAFAKNYFEACNEFRRFYEECAFFVSKGRFFSLQIDGEDRCAQLIGNGNAEGDVGLCIWPDAATARKSARSNGNSGNSITGTVVLFWQPSEAPPAEVRFASRVGCKIEETNCGRYFPVLTVDMGERAVTWRDARLTLAALRAAPLFYRSLLATRTVPPAPYPTIYGFVETEEQFSIASFGLRGKAETIGCTLRVPPFKLPATERPFRDRDVARWAVRPDRPDLPPPSVQTVGEAVEHYQAQRAATRVGDGAWRMASYGLAIALWMCESEATTSRAIDLWRELLDSGTDGRTDREGCRYTLLDHLLEAGRWEAVVKLLERYADEWSTEWAWSAALVLLRSRGLRSKTAREALCNAVLCNPHVYPLLLGDKFIGSTWHGQSSGHHTTRAGTFADENAAGGYLNVHRCHWTAFGRTTEGGYEAVLAAVRAAGAEAYQAWQQKTAEELTTRASRPPREPKNMDDVTAALSDLGDWQTHFKEMKASGSVVLPGGGLFANIKVPTAEGTLCARCGQFGEGLSKCKGCLFVVYCGRECQRAHWPSHKAACKARRCVGQRVELHSLGTAALNGQRGRAMAWVVEKERLSVRLESDGREVAVKHANLRIVDEAQAQAVPLV